MRKRIWFGIVEIEYATGEAPDKLKRAFTTVTTWACNNGEFSRKCKEMLEHYGWRLLGVEEAEPVKKNQKFSRNVEEMVRRTRANPSAVIYGTFHTYPLRTPEHPCARTRA